ncbi:hypothetical protein AACH06_05930 [Ideonella sp. DXS29W]|uniref:DUF4136 domain-containing protein n=1 Tax=Ideonella lacteola TaxID=2984193 RepID=A0ABU9BP94_9BURK
MALAGCATRSVDAQWASPQLMGSPLQGAKVFVVCEAAEEVMGRICLDKLTADLTARGLTPVARADTAAPPATQARDDARYLPEARAAGAKAVWVASVGPDALAERSSGSGLSIGFGGFGFGRNTSLGVGVSVPVGGAPAAPYAADARVSDVDKGLLLWTARAGSPPSGDARTQVEALLQRLVGAAGEAKVF